MNIEQIRNYCNSFSGVSESFPFDESTLVFKVMGKMFGLMSLEGDATINLKCNPEIALELREEHPEILPGYHMSKVHWNTVCFNGNLKSDLVFSMIRDSYNLVVAGLPLKLRVELHKQSK
jgi:predicted DNA-binding protein (MmcQ/YjbR family)